MKKFTLSILAVLIAAFVMTSCIDNAVSPEVKAIRAAQVNYVNALTAHTTALAAKETALAAYNTALAAVQNANAADIAASTAAQLIANQIALSNAEAAIAANEIAIQASLNDLAELIAEYGATQAGIYLGKYQLASAKVQGIAADIAAKVKLIAGLQLYFNTGEGADYATVQLWLARALAEAQVELTSAEAALAIVVDAEADPTDAAEDLALVDKRLQEITNEILAFNVDLVPLEEPLDDANDDLDDASDDLTDAQDLVDAIDLILAEYANQEADVAAAEDDAADALADAIAASAELQAELDPFLTALLDAYATNSAYPGIVAGLEHDLRVAVNMWKVAVAQGNALVNQDPANDVEDAPGYDDAVSALQDAVTAIEDLTEVDTDIDVEDETSYPDFDAMYGEYEFTVNATVGALAMGDTYSMGGVTYTIQSAYAGGATSIYVSGRADHPGAVTGTLTKVSSPTGDATMTVTAKTAVYTFSENDEDGIFEEYEIDDLYDDLVNNTLANPDPASAYAGASVLYNAVKPFFQGGDAEQLVDDIGRYDGANFLYNLTDENSPDFADGVVADLPDDGNGDNGFDDYWDALDEVATQEDYLEDMEDASSTDAALDTGGATTGDLQDAYDYLADFTGGDGGSDDANDEKAGADADLAAAETAYDDADAAQATAQANYDVIGDQIDDLQIEEADLLLVQAALDDLVNGINLDITAFKDAVEDAQAGVDAAQKAIDDLTADIAEVGETITHEQGRLADLRLELAAAQAEAAAWLALLNAALAG